MAEGRLEEGAEDLGEASEITERMNGPDESEKKEGAGQEEGVGKEEEEEEGVVKEAQDEIEKEEEGIDKEKEERTTKPEKTSSKSSRRSRKKKGVKDSGGHKELEKLLRGMALKEGEKMGRKIVGVPPEEVDGKGIEHQFWDTQPVPKLDDKVSDMGPLREDHLEEIRTEPLTLPANFVWSDVDLDNEDQISELYQLLHENYVEDDDNMFRFDYSRNFLRWALKPPGWLPAWYTGVRVSTSKKLVGFISAVPAQVRVRGHEQRMVEINFLCVHKKLRSKRVTPVLIREITRRVNMEGIFQAIYTAGVLLPKPVSVCRYWHRSLNPKKLVDVQFSALHQRMTLQRMIRIYRLPEETKTRGLRPAQKKDMPAILERLNQYLRQFDLAPVFQTVEEVEHWLTPRDQIISCYVVENQETGELTDMVSFYHLPSSIMNHPLHKKLYVTYLFYCFHTVTPLRDLLYDALILAKKMGADVFNSLDIMENRAVYEDLKFGVGDGNLHYYFYNWKCPELPPDKVALVLQ